MELLATYTSNSSPAHATWLELINEKCGEATDLQEILKGIDACSNCKGSYRGSSEVEASIQRVAAQADELEVALARIKVEERSSGSPIKDTPQHAQDSVVAMDVNTLIASHKRLVDTIKKPPPSVRQPPTDRDVDIRTPAYYLKQLL